MGSEGRGEQTIRTDQDNGLIFANPSPRTILPRFARRSPAALERFGFPPCPGNVMVRNPHWSKTADEFRADFRRWLALRDENALMNVAIFYDAEAVAGDPDLLRRHQAELIEAMSGEPAASGAFRASGGRVSLADRPVQQSRRPEIEGDALDLKKGGIFPIVHGVRALAIEHRLSETGTAARIERLAEAGALTHGFRARIDAGACAI